MSRPCATLYENGCALGGETLTIEYSGERAARRVEVVKESDITCKTVYQPQILVELTEG